MEKKTCWRIPWPSSGGGEGSILGNQFSQFVMHGISRWREIIQDWLSLGQEIYLIFYENLRDEPVEEIRKLLIYLNIPVNEGRLDCIRRHSSGSFHRTVHQQESPFTEEQDKLIREAIAVANSMIKQKTGMELPLAKYTFINNFRFFYNKI